MSRCRLSLSLAVCLFGAGCGDSSYVPVSGSVTFDGKPLADAIVTFQPMATERSDVGGVGSFGRTDEQGRFTLEAMTPSPRKGALVGKHRVSIGTVGEVADQTSDAASTSPIPQLKPDIIPPRYNTQSTLECDVPPGGLTDVKFELTSR
jgi:hypothetical protein